jgi:PAS domain S-box-containing protein
MTLLFWERQGIAARMSLIIVAILLAAGVMLLALGLHQIAGTTEQELTIRLNARLVWLSSNCRDPAIVGDFALIEQILDEQTRLQDAFEVTFQGKRGSVITKKGHPANLIAPDWFADLLNIPHAEGHRAIEAGGHHYGEITIVLSPNRAINAAWMNILAIAATAFITLCAVILGILYFLRRQLQPLQTLAAAVMAFGKGELSERLALTGTPELRTVIDAFNEMINERKRQEQAREEALIRLQKITSRVPGVVYQYLLRPDGSACFPFVSAGIREIFHLSPEEACLDASKVFANIHPEDYDSLNRSIQKSAQELTQWHQEYRLKFADGTVQWLSGNSMPQQEADGSVLWYGFTTDITERKNAEQALHCSEERLTLAIRAVGIGTWDYDPVHNSIVWDDAMFALYGSKREDFSGINDPWQTLVHPEDCSRGNQEFQQALQGVKPLDTEFRVLHPNGELHYIKALAEVFRDEKGRPTRVIGLNWDISAQKSAQISLIEAQRVADSANAAKSQFLATMSHELRTPLNGIMGMAQILAQHPIEDADRVSYAKIILDSGNSLLALLNDILDISKIEAGKVDLESIACTPALILEEVQCLYTEASFDKGLQSS